MVSRTNRWALAIGLGTLAIVGATLYLGYASHLAAVRSVERSERSLARENRVVGRRLVDRIERVVIDSDRTLFRMVRLDDPSEFRELWRRIVRASPVVQSIVVLDQDQRILHLVSTMSTADQERFRERLGTQLLPAMDLSALPADAHRHLHRGRPRDGLLISYLKREFQERRCTADDLFDPRSYTIALQMRLAYFIDRVFEEELGRLLETRHVAVVDEEGRQVWGPALPADASPVFTARFPTTLYHWRLRTAPLGTAVLRDEALRRGHLGLAAVVVADLLILVGVATLLIAARTERRANQLKSRFVANVTHELKTPLSLIRMFGELLSLGRAPSPEAAKEYAAIIMRESERLGWLIDNILDFARMERGKSALSLSPGPLEPVVRRTVDLLRHRAEQAGVTIDLRVEPDLPEVERDEGAVALLLLNLLDNALKYGAPGGGAVTVTLGRRDREVSLAVADRGPGLKDPEIPHVFDRFYRGSRLGEVPVRGSGIGLSLVRHVAEAHGGTARAENRAGGGARFVATFPAP